MSAIPFDLQIGQGWMVSAGGKSKEDLQAIKAELGVGAKRRGRARKRVYVLRTRRAMRRTRRPLLRLARHRTFSQARQRVPAAEEDVLDPLSRRSHEPPELGCRRAQDLDKIH